MHRDQVREEMLLLVPDKPHSMLTLPLIHSIGTQALVRGSPNSSMSADDRVNPVCRARAVVDHIANPFDKDALSFKVIKLPFFNNDPQ